MKKNLQILASVFLLSSFLVACADDGENQEEPITPDVPGEEMPEDGMETDPGTETDEGL